jgi:hypothetical protein
MMTFQNNGNVAGEDLSWFWRSWFVNNWRLDQTNTIKYVKMIPQGVVINREFDKMVANSFRRKTKKWESEPCKTAG